MLGLPSLVHRLWPRKRVFDAPVAPDHPFVAVGDIHGRIDLLVTLMERLSLDYPHHPLVFLGDYVDRGPDSAGVLRYLKTLEQDSGKTVICLMGNHEAMLLDFLAAPDMSGPLWLRNGGGETLRSFGIDPNGETNDTMAAALRHSAGDELINWIGRRPLVWRSGQVVATHAGGDPSAPIEPRRGHGLLWGHPKLMSEPRWDGLWMVHGHYIVEEPQHRQSRISIDTGAFRTGRLTAAVIGKGTVEFISSGDAHG